MSEAFVKNSMNLNMINEKEVSLSFSEVTKLEDLEEINRVLAEFTIETELDVDSLDEDASPFSPAL